MFLSQIYNQLKCIACKNPSVSQNFPNSCQMLRCRSDLRPKQNRWWTRSSSDYQIRLQPRRSWAEDRGRGGKSVGDIRRLGKCPELSSLSSPHWEHWSGHYKHQIRDTRLLQLSPTSSTVLLSNPSPLFPSILHFLDTFQCALRTIGRKMGPVDTFNIWIEWIMCEENEFTNKWNGRGDTSPLPLPPVRMAWLSWWQLLTRAWNEG